jgi:hydrogenase nickel incorporation protein HypA/HybF
MHEYSVVQALLDQCEENAKANDATKVTKVVLKIGVMSGIETSLLERAFDTFKEKTVCDAAELVINTQALTIECHDCKKASELEKNRYNCPNCESTNVKVIDGEDMFLMSLEME